MSALLPALDRAFDHRLVHSGQHYSPNMDRVFFDELGLRDPDHSLGVGSRPPGAQTAAILEGVERLILDIAPDAVLVHGDTNTTLGAALAACKYPAIRLIHVEAGTRSGNRSQPEEINRLLVDRVSTLLFVLREEDLVALELEGIDPSHSVVTGSTVFDSCTRAAALPGASEVLATHGLSPAQYAIATVHRQETTDDRERLAAVWSALARAARAIRVVVPIHPRTRSRLEGFDIPLEAPNLQVIEPVGYREMMALLSQARFCLTDSGGLMEEAAILGIPALILREETEHRAYVESGMHRMVGTDADRIVAQAERLARDAQERGDRARRKPTPPEHSPTETIVAELNRRLDAAPTDMEEPTG